MRPTDASKKPDLNSFASIVPEVPGFPAQTTTHMTPAATLAAQSLRKTPVQPNHRSEVVEGVLDGVSYGADALGNLAAEQVRVLEGSEKMASATGRFISTPIATAISMNANLADERAKGASNPGARAATRTGRDMLLAEVPIVGTVQAIAGVAGSIARVTDPIAEKLTAHRERTVDLSKPLSDADEGWLEAEAMMRAPRLMADGIHAATDWSVDQAAKGLHYVGAHDAAALLHSDPRAFESPGLNPASVLAPKFFPGYPSHTDDALEMAPPVKLPVASILPGISQQAVSNPKNRPSKSRPVTESRAAPLGQRSKLVRLKPDLTTTHGDTFSPPPALPTNAPPRIPGTSGSLSVNDAGLLLVVAAPLTPLTAGAAAITVAGVEAYDAVTLKRKFPYQPPVPMSSEAASMHLGQEYSAAPDFAKDSELIGLRQALDHLDQEVPNDSNREIRADGHQATIVSRGISWLVNKLPRKWVHVTKPDEAKQITSLHQREREELQKKFDDRVAALEASTSAPSEPIVPVAAENFLGSQSLKKTRVETELTASEEMIHPVPVSAVDDEEIEVDVETLEEMPTQSAAEPGVSLREIADLSSALYGTAAGLFRILAPAPQAPLPQPPHSTAGFTGSLFQPDHTCTSSDKGMPSAKGPESKFKI